MKVGKKMDIKNELPKEEILKAIAQKEFSIDVLNSAKSVIIIMTQDWCPQWTSMKKWIYNFNDENCKVYEIIYNNKEYSKEFMAFKETIFGNDLIPYVRIYKDGKFYKECNYRSEPMFAQLLK
jgi:hypothetical protein